MDHITLIEPSIAAQFAEPITSFDLWTKPEQIGRQGPRSRTLPGFCVSPLGWNTAFGQQTKRVQTPM
jgi:hypothetical protein